jgi:hypothetical protein
LSQEAILADASCAGGLPRIHQHEPGAEDDTSFPPVIDRHRNLWRHGCLHGLVVVGAGLRLRTDMFFLFERILNAVHELAPKARIALHATPVDFDEAVIRVSGGGD